MTLYVYTTNLIVRFDTENKQTQMDEKTEGCYQAHYLHALRSWTRHVLLAEDQHRGPLHSAFLWVRPISLGYEAGNLLMCKMFRNSFCFRFCHNSLRGKAVHWGLFILNKIAAKKKKRHNDNNITRQLPLSLPPKKGWYPKIRCILRVFNRPKVAVP